jgi:hypothetical protein
VLVDLRVVTEHMVDRILANELEVRDDLEILDDDSVELDVARLRMLVVETDERDVVLEAEGVADVTELDMPEDLL